MSASHTLSAEALERGEVITVVRTLGQPLGKRFTLAADGTVEKHAAGTPAYCCARMVPVPDAEALARVLEEVADAPDAAIINGGFKHVEIGESFAVLSEGEIERRFGVSSRENTAGVHHLSDDPNGCTKAVGRFKENVLSSAWVLLDRDVDEHTPPQLAALDHAAWLARVDDLLPGVSECDRVVVPSASRRVLHKGQPMGVGNGHTWVRIANPADVSRLRTGLIARALEYGLAWPKPRRNREGKIVGQSPATIVDPSVWNVGRLVFCGKPSAEGDGLTVAPQGIEVVPGLFGPVLDTGGIEFPAPERANELAEAAGFGVRFSADGSTMVAQSYDLEFATEIEVKGHGLMTVKDALDLLPEGRKLPCQAPFRASSSWAAYLARAKDGRPFVHDSGNGSGTNHWLSHYDWEAKDFAVLPELTEEENARNAAREAERKQVSQKCGNGRFNVSGRGVFWVGADDDGNAKPPMWVCSQLRIVGATRDARGSEWGRLLEWRDRDGVLHRWSMPMEMLQGDAADVRRELARGGLEIATGRAAREMLAAYLQSWRVNARVRCVEHLGWNGSVFLTPSGTIGSSEEDVVFQSAGTVAPAMSQAGTVAEWQQTVAALAPGNSRAVFALSVSFAASLLYPAGVDGGGFHLRGNSSCGKTTLLHVAASVWGHPPEYMRTWRATANGLEGVAAMHNDGLLLLDEMGQIDPAQAGQVAYMLANGTGKARASRSGAARQSLRWRLIFLSSGELSLADHMAGARERAHAGQELRLCDIEADAGSGMGAFEQLHGCTTPAAFAQSLKDGAERYHGAVGIEWLRRIVAERDTLSATLRENLDRLCAVWVPAGSSGQVHRVARRFALVAAAGEKATGYGLTGWLAGESERAAKVCFDAWLAAFGADGNREERAMLAQVAAFIEAHGASRFQRFGTMDIESEDAGFGISDPRILNRVGFVRAGANGSREYLVLPEVFRREVCKGFDPKMATRALLAHGWLKPGSDGKPQAAVRLPGYGQKRCYVLRMPDDAPMGGGA